MIVRLSVIESILNWVTHHDNTSSSFLVGVLSMLFAYTVSKKHHPITDNWRSGGKIYP